MSRDEGFQVADISTSLLDDPKVRSLWRKLRDAGAMDGAMMVFLSVILESWRDGERASAGESAPMWRDDVEGSVRALSEVGLLDEAGRLPEMAWRSWFDPAFQRRERRRNSGSLGGHQKAANAGAASSTDMAQPDQLSSTAMAQPEQSPSIALPVRPTVLPSVQPTDVSSLRDGAGAPQSDREWVAYVVEHDPKGRVSNGRPLTPSRERIARLADYWALRFGEPLPGSSFGRLAKALSDHPGGAPGLMSDLSDAALRGVAGDPLDYIAGKLRRGRASTASVGIPQPDGFDRDSYSLKG